MNVISGMGSSAYQDPDDWKPDEDKTDNEEKTRDLEEIIRIEIKPLSKWWNVFAIIAFIVCLALLGYLLCSLPTIPLAPR